MNGPSQNSGRAPRRGIQQALFTQPLPRPTEPDPVLDRRAQVLHASARVSQAKRVRRKGRPR